MRHLESHFVITGVFVAVEGVFIWLTETPPHPAHAGRDANRAGVIPPSLSLPRSVLVTTRMMIEWK